MRSIAIILLCLATSLLAPGHEALAGGGCSVVVPIVFAQSPGQEEPPSNANAQAMAALITLDARQQRPSMTPDPVLQQVAQARAEDMANRDYFAHVNPDGYGPNYLVRAAGYPLPSYYDTSVTGNSIESIAAGDDDAQAIFEAWLASPPHRQHILGEVDFFAQQVEYGVGYATNPNSTYTYYWVFISAKKGS